MPALSSYFPGLVPPLVYELNDEELSVYLRAIEKHQSEVKRG